MTESADRIFARLEPLTAVDDDSATLLEDIAVALGHGATPVDEVVRDTETHTAWSMILDPDVAPSWALEWLSQFPGVKLLPADDEATQRSRILQAAGFFRGTPQAIRDEVARTTTSGDPDQVTVLTHVGGDRWAMTVLLRTADTPDEAASERAALRQKPAGIEPYLVLVTDDVIWEEATLDWASVVGTVDWASVLLADVT